MTKIPHCSEVAWPEAISPERFAAKVSTTPEGCAVALIGLADDLGVRLNGGRVGAREGPRAFREALARYGVAEPYRWDWPRVFDAGDVIPAEGDDEAALHETHRRVTEATRAVLELGLFPIGIGGGHDLTFPFVRGVIEHFRARTAERFRGLYFDAHLDVRETAGSGMPFRALVEQCGVGRLDVLGWSPLANARAYVTWFEANGGVLHYGKWNDTLEPDYWGIAGGAFVSLDLDVIDAAHAPGVSAMNPCGWSPRDFDRWLGLAGQSPSVRCFDIMELSPPHDEGGRTARLAAHLFLGFLRGFAERPA